MNLTISKTEFYNTLQLVSRAISPNSPQTSLRGLKIDVKDNSMVVTDSVLNRNIRITTSHNHRVIFNINL